MSSNGKGSVHSTVIGCNYLLLSLYFIYVFNNVVNRERKKQEENSSEIPERDIFQNGHILLDEEKMAKERKKKLKKLLIQTFKENHQVGIIMSLYSAYCSISDKGFHQSWDRVTTLSPAELHHKYQNCPNHSFCAAQCLGSAQPPVQGLFLYTLFEPQKQGDEFETSS